MKEDEQTMEERNIELAEKLLDRLKRLENRMRVMLFLFVIITTGLLLWVWIG